MRGAFLFMRSVSRSFSINRSSSLTLLKRSVSNLTHNQLRHLSNDHLAKQPPLFIKNNNWSLPILNIQKRYSATYIANDYSTHHNNNIFDKFTFKSLKDHLTWLKEENLLNDRAYFDDFHIESKEGLGIGLEAACAKLECLQEDYCPDEPDRVFNLNLSRIFDALVIFLDILEYPSSAAENIKRVALEYLCQFQEDLKNLVTPKDQKREYYLKIESTLNKFLKEETAKLALEPAAAMDCER